MGKSSEAYGASQPNTTAVPHSNNPFRRFMGSSNNQQALGTDNVSYNPPPGPPPSKKDTGHEYAPPSGPPPSHPQQYAAPPGPPPKKHTEDGPPPYDPWLAVPDNALLPPPPALSNDRSPTANAPEELAALAKTWCRANPLFNAAQYDQRALSAIDSGALTLVKRPEMSVQVTSQPPGSCVVKSQRNTRDTFLQSQLPLYAAQYHDPTRTGRPRTIYFEVKLVEVDQRSSADGEVSAAIALGFAATPYPTFRLPGWERASLGVHGDDGRRYVCDDRGGRDFTTYFQESQTLGLGMKYGPPSYGERRPRVEIFFTRDGKKEGSWDLWEERDQGDVDEGVGDQYGLAGDRDVFAAVGLFGKVHFVFKARREEWLYRPDLH